MNDKLIFQLNQPSNKLLLVTTTAAYLGAIATFVNELQWHPIAVAAFALALLFLVNKFLILVEFEYDPESHFLTRSKKVFGITLSKMSYDLNKYSGIRNRVHWGWYTQCNTELVTETGDYVPIRIEWGAREITSVALTFKESISQKLGLKLLRDQALL